MRKDKACTRSEPQAEVVDVPEAAKILGVSRNSGYEAVKRKEIPSIRIGRRLRCRAPPSTGSSPEISDDGAIRWAADATPPRGQSSHPP